MIQTQDSTQAFLSQFSLLERESFAADPPWLTRVRKAAIARFGELGFPTTRDEEWRYTNVAPIAATAFEPGESVQENVTPEQIAPFRFAGDDACLLVFVNGRYSAALSSAGTLPAELNVVTLADAIAADAKVLEPHLARHAKYDDQSFVALNTAFMRDGALVHIPRGVVVERPIHLMYVSTATETPIVSHPRNLIVAETNSQATIVESHVGIGNGVYLTNTVTEIVAAENAVIDHYKVERETEEAFHTGAICLHQYRASNVTTHTISFGGTLVRNDLHTVLDGEGCESTMNGLTVISGNQHVDNHLRIEHAKPHCNSREYYKGVFDGKSRGVFSGRILVHEGAQKTDAKQTNMSLLLSEDAQVESKPQLEIFANDVKCTHGATIGQIDDEAIFYLCSRGIKKEAARSLLVLAFARQLLDEIKIEPLRAGLEELLLSRLPQGELLRGAM